MTDEQVKKRAKLAWSPAARKKRKATIAARKKALGGPPIIFSKPSPSAKDETFTAAQVAAIIREILNGRKT